MCIYITDSVCCTPETNILNQQYFNIGTSLVAQWFRLRLTMHKTQVQSLVQEDPTCHGVTKPACLEPVLRDKRSHRDEKPAHHNE